MKEIKKSVLVVGGTGFIGYHLIKFLQKKKFVITSISTKKPKKLRKLKKVEYLKCNISKINDLKKIDKQFDHIVNLGGYVNHHNKKLTYESHYIGSVNLYNVFKETKLKSFIQIGSSLEYGKTKSPQNEDKLSKPRSIYAKSKQLSSKFFLEKFKKNNFPVVILRGYQIYGPKQDNNRLIPIVINNCLRNKSFPCTKGNQLRDFLFIDDFVRAIYIALKKKRALGKAINIGYGEPIKVKTIISKIVSIIKKGKPQFGKINIRKDEIKYLYPSITKAYKIMNWQPKVKLFNGLKKTILSFNKKN